MPSDATSLAENNDSTYPDSATDASVKQHQLDHDALAHFTNHHPTDADPHGDRAYADGAIATAIAGVSGTGLSQAAVQALINVTQINTQTDNYTLQLSDAGKMVINNTNPGGGSLVTYISNSGTAAGTFTAANGTVPPAFVHGEWNTGSAITVQSNQAVFTSPAANDFSGTAGMFSTDGTTALQVADIDITFTFVMNAAGFPVIIARSNTQAWSGTGYEINLNNGSLKIIRQNSFTQYTLATSSFSGASVGTTYTVRYQIVGNVHSVWIAAGTTLPGTPTVTVTDSSTFGGTVITAAGFAGIHWGSGGTGGITMNVDNLLVTNGASGSSGGGPNWIVPKNSAVAFPLGTMVYGMQLGTQQALIVPVDSSVTLLSAGGLHAARLQNSQWQIMKIGTDTWALDGDLA